MKTLRRKGLILTLAIVLVLTAAFVMTACEDNSELGARLIITVTDGAVSVVSYDENNESSTIYLGTTAKTNLDELLVELSGRSVLNIKRQESDYGAFYTEIGALKQTINQYIHICTDLTEYQVEFLDDYSMEAKDSGVNYVTANVGASGLPITASCHFLITLR